MNKDRFLGMCVVLAIGDALGTPFEFEYGRLPYKSKLVEHGQFKLGQVSDDSEMMIACLNTLDKNKKWVEDEVIMAYSDWVRSGPPDLGVNTVQLFYSMMPSKALANYKAHKESKLSQPIHMWSESNGCLMRNAVLAFFEPSQNIWLQVY